MRPTRPWCLTVFAGRENSRHMAGVLRRNENRNGKERDNDECWRSRNRVFHSRNIVHSHGMSRIQHYSGKAIRMGPTS